LSGQALIQPQTAITTKAALPFSAHSIGTYAVTFELAGFKKTIRDGIVIQAVSTRKSTPDGHLDRPGDGDGQRREPGRRHRSTAISASFNKEALDKIPSARDPWVILEQTPGVLMSGSNVGGNLSGSRPRSRRWAAAPISSGRWTAP